MACEHWSNRQSFLSRQPHGHVMSMSFNNLYVKTISWQSIWNVQNQGDFRTTVISRNDSQWAGILLCEIWQVDISKVDKQHPNCLFWGVQEPAERRDKWCATEALQRDSFDAFAKKTYFGLLSSLTRFSRVSSHVWAPWSASLCRKECATKIVGFYYRSHIKIQRYTQNQSNRISLVFI